MKDEFTIMIPIHKRYPSLANDCLKNLLATSDLNIYCIIDTDDHNEYIKNKRIKFVYNKIKNPSMSKLLNQCIKECPTDNVIIAYWRQRPTPKHFELIKNKLKEGYGMVTFDAMHFSAFNKYLTTMVGFFDEGFTRGQFEDTDWFNRMRTHDIAIYEGKIDEQRISEGKYIESMWLKGSEKNKKYYDSKWIEDHENKTLIQLKEEKNKNDRNLFKSLRPKKYLPWNRSVLGPNLEKYFFEIFPNYIQRF